MADIFTTISLCCFFIMAVSYVWGAAWHFVDALRYIMSGNIDEEEFAYNYTKPKHKRTRANVRGRRVANPRVRSNALDTRPNWVYSTML